MTQLLSTAQTMQQLIDALPKNTVITDPDILAGYAHDEAVLAPFELPLALERVQSSEHTAIVVN